MTGSAIVSRYNICGGAKVTCAPKRSRTTVEALEIKGYRYAAVDKQVKRMKLRTLQVTTNDFLFLALSLLWISLAMLGSALF